MDGPDFCRVSENHVQRLVAVPEVVEIGDARRPQIQPRFRPHLDTGIGCQPSKHFTAIARGFEHAFKYERIGLAAHVFQFIPDFGEQRDFTPAGFRFLVNANDRIGHITEYLESALGFAPKTVHERFKSLRRSFRYAQSKGAIVCNPFNDVRAGKDAGTPSRYVPAETVEKILPYCVDDETRLALVFGRFAGVRMPSEIQDLKWSDIEKARFHVRKGKTGARVVPLFHRVAEELKKQERKSEWVFPLEHRASYSRSYWNIRRAVELAGIEPWPKLLNSLRASCITEFAHQNFHEVTLNAVFGNSESVRKKHYIKVRDEEYEAMMVAGKRILRNNNTNIRFDLLKEVLPLLSKKDLLRLWENARNDV